MTTDNGKQTIALEDASDQIGSRFEELAKKLHRNGQGEFARHLEELAGEARTAFATVAEKEAHANAILEQASRRKPYVNSVADYLGINPALALNALRHASQESHSEVVPARQIPVFEAELLGEPARVYHWAGQPELRWAEWTGPGQRPLVLIDWWSPVQAPDTDGEFQLVNHFAGWRNHDIAVENAKANAKRYVGNALPWLPDEMRGKQALVCGSGPSLDNATPELIARWRALGGIVIAINDAANHIGDPDIMFVVDPTYNNPDHNDGKLALEDHVRPRVAFLSVFSQPSIGKALRKRGTKTIYFTPHGWVPDHKDITDDERAVFAKCDGLTCEMTAVYPCVQAAFRWIDAQAVVLVGVDCGWQAEGGTYHWDGRPRKIQRKADNEFLPMEDRLIPTQDCYQRPFWTTGTMRAQMCRLALQMLFVQDQGAPRSTLYADAPKRRLLNASEGLEIPGADTVPLSVVVASLEKP